METFFLKNATRRWVEKALIYVKVAQYPPTRTVTFRNAVSARSIARHAHRDIAEGRCKRDGRKTTLQQVFSCLQGRT
jgi:hypothetical protein